MIRKWGDNMKRLAPCLLAVLLLFNIGIVSAASPPYVGNKTTKVYHMIECTWGQKIGVSNRIYFNSREIAENRGYRRCHYCGDGLVEKGNGGGSGSISAQQPQTNATIATKPSADKASDNTNGVHPLFWVIVGALLAWAVYRLAQAWRKGKEQKQKNAEIKDSNQRILQSLKCENVSVPSGIVLTPDGTPISGVTNVYKPYGDYTVYISPKGTRFHASRRCCPQGVPVHLFKIPPHIPPCKNCVSEMMSRKNIPGWYSELTAKAQMPKAPAANEENIPEGITPIALKSSFITTAAYADSVLYLTFKDGGRYAYYQVPPHIYEELISAQSPGKYFQEKIINKYPYM